MNSDRVWRCLWLNGSHIFNSFYSTRKTVPNIWYSHDVSRNYHALSPDWGLIGRILRFSDRGQSHMHGLSKGCVTQDLHHKCCVPRITPGYYSERPRGAGFRSVNPAERWRENPARALARAGFSQHLECGIHRSESSPEGSFALIPHPVARWAKTTP